MVNEGQDHVSIEQKTFALAGMSYIGKLVGTDIQLVRQNLPVTGSLVEHDNKVRIFKDILHLAAGEQVVG